MLSFLKSLVFGAPADESGHRGTAPGTQTDIEHSRRALRTTTAQLADVRSRIDESKASMKRLQQLQEEMTIKRQELLMETYDAFLHPELLREQEEGHPSSSSVDDSNPPSAPKKEDEGTTTRTPPLSAESGASSVTSTASSCLVPAVAASSHDASSASFMPTTSAAAGAGSSTLSLRALLKHRQILEHDFRKALLVFEDKQATVEANAFRLELRLNDLQRTQEKCLRTLQQLSPAAYEEELREVVALTPCSPVALAYAAGRRGDAADTSAAASSVHDVPVAAAPGISTSSAAQRRIDFFDLTASRATARRGAKKATSVRVGILESSSTDDDDDDRAAAAGPAAAAVAVPSV